MIFSTSLDLLLVACDIVNKIDKYNLSADDNYLTSTTKSLTV